MSPFIIYFSSVTENTKRFVDKLGFENERIPLKKAESFKADKKYVLIVPTYGGGSVKGAVPKQVIKFLNEESNRNLCIGVISSGNTNFGEAYSIAGDIVAKKLGVPKLYSFELLGTSTDVDKVRSGLIDNWEQLLSLK